MKPDQLRDFPVVISLPVQWGDQDAFGHVNNTVAIRWFESSRIAYISASEMDHMMEAGGIGPILVSITCNYRRQLHHPDTVHIGARVTKLGRSSMVIEHVVYSERLDELAADGTSTLVAFDYKKNRPTRIPDELRRECERLEGRSIDG